MNPAGTQLLLPLGPPPAPSFANFAVGGNGELIGQLQELAESRNATSLYLWGPTGSGKTHLLQATAQAAALRRPVLWLASKRAETDPVLAPATLIVVDDVANLDDEAQTALFRLFNSARLAGLALLIAGRQPALELSLREDLRTRIGQALSYQLAAATDADRRDALLRHAAQRGMRLDASLIEYLLRHGRRDLPSLMQVLDELDHASLRAKRLPTLPLLRELLQSPVRT